MFYYMGYALHCTCKDPILMQEKQVDHLRRLKEKVKTPEGVPRLFDLITIKDEKLKLAFFAAIGNTVVAKDLDQVKLSVEILFQLSILNNSVHKYNFAVSYKLLQTNLEYSSQYTGVVAILELNTLVW